jgi:hypothetical protein
MQEPEENRNTPILDIVDGGVEIGSELAVEGIFDTVGGFLGDAVGGILDGVSIDI